jgi:hypothetical protein
VLAVRLLILLVLAYLVFVIINILFSSSRTTPLKRNRNLVDKGEELVLGLQCQSYVPKAEASCGTRQATRAGGRVGDAAKAVAKVLHEHFVKEEEFALPALGLLSGLRELLLRSVDRLIHPNNEAAL